MVNKITSPITPLGEIDKINEIIDELDNIDPLPSQTGQSGKYLTTNGTVPSWAEVQSLPSQTGKAGKFLQTDGSTASWESAPFRNIGEIVASTIPLTDAGLHLLDGALIQGSGIYSAFVDYIAGLDLTANYFCTEAEWQTAVTTYGVCGKFVYNSVNNTVRLPKITGILEGTIDVTALGDLVEAGLPNLTGLTKSRDVPQTANNAFYKTYGENQLNTGWTTDNNAAAFDASLSNSIYGNSTTVQPQTIKAFYYIVIATSSKTDIQVDIDEVVTDLNGKADTDLSNVPTSKGILTETYVNGSSWYRVYSDGWCEQGGIAVTGTYNVSLLKPFVNTNYYIGAHHINSDTTLHIIIDNNTINGFTLQSGQYSDRRSNVIANTNWYACGYIS